MTTREPRNRRKSFWSVRSRHLLVVFALSGQFVALTLGWFVTFRVVQRRFAGVIQEQVIAQNKEFAQTLAALFDDELRQQAMDRMTETGELDVEFGSEDWEPLQRLIENDALSMLPAGGFACLIEGDGRLLCHPEIRERPGLRDFSFGGYDLRPTLGSAERAAIVEAGMDGEVASGVTEFSGGRFHYLATTEIGDSGLRLLIHQPVDELVKVGEESTAFIAVVAGAMAVVMLGITGGGLTFLLRRYDGVHEALNRQLHANLETARRIQRGTLPTRWPRPDGWEIAGWCDPAEETGGDSFDIFGLIQIEGESANGSGFGLSESSAERGVALVLADATGHGVGPALAVTQLQSMVRVAWRTRDSLMDVARLVSESLFGALPEGRFITAWLARLDLDAGWLEMYSAGQGPLFSVSAEGEVAVSAADGLPLGITDAIGPGPRRISMGVGDLFVVVSDGLIEERDADGEQFGDERLAALIVEHRAESAERIAEVLRGALARFTPRAATDDRTVVVVKRTA